MAHKTQFKHKACGTELHMDADLEDRFYNDPTAVVKIYCPTCQSLFACSGFAWVDNDLPVEPGHPDNELPDGEEEPPAPDNSLPVGPEGPSNELPGDQPAPDQGLPGAQPGPDQGLPPGEAPVDPGYGVGAEQPNQDLPEPNPNPNPDVDIDVDVDRDQIKPGRPDQGLPPGAEPKE